jgi:UrcA family protein
VTPIDAQSQVDERVMIDRSDGRIPSLNRSLLTPWFEPPFERKLVCWRRNTMKNLVFATAALGLALTGAPAFAEDAEVKTTTVSSAGLDLSTPEGQRILDKRVEAAARNVCDIRTVSTESRIKSVSARSCYNKALASAKSQVATLVQDQQRGG